MIDGNKLSTVLFDLVGDLALLAEPGKRREADRLHAQIEQGLVAMGEAFRALRDIEAKVFHAEKELVLRLKQIDDLNEGL